MTAGARAEIEITASTSRLPAQLRAAAAMYKDFARGVDVATSPLQKLGGIVGNAALHGAVFRGMDALIDQGKEIFDFNKQLTRFGIAARIGGAALQGVGQTIRQVSSDTGVSAVEVLRGARAYVDLAGASKYSTEKMSLLARSAQASGSDIGDMATVVYALQHSLNIPDTELENTIGGLINLSKDGAVHFNQMAQELIELAPVFSQFGVTGRQGAISLASQLEVIRTGFGSASQASTGLLRLMRSLPQHASLFRKFGVEIFKKGSRTELETLDTILKRIAASPLQKNREALIKAFGRGEAERSYQLLDKLINEYHALEEAGQRTGVIQQDLATYTESASGRMDIAIQRLKNKVAETFTPERIDAFVTAIEDAARKVGPLVEAVAKIGEIIGGIYSIGKSIRSFVTPDDSRVYAASPTEIEANASFKGISVQESARDLENQHGVFLATKRRISSMLRDGEYETKESDKAAVAASITPETVPGFEGARQAGQSYIQASEMTPARFHELLKEVQKDAVDAAVKSGTARSVAKEDLVDAFNTAIRQTLVPALNRSEGKPISVQVDGNPVARAASNATDRRRK